MAQDKSNGRGVSNVPTRMNASEGGGIAALAQGLAQFAKLFDRLPAAGAVFDGVRCALGLAGWRLRAGRAEPGSPGFDELGLAGAAFSAPGHCSSPILRLSKFCGADGTGFET